MEKLEKWQPKHKVSTARGRKQRMGYSNIGQHSGRQGLAHGYVEQMEKGDTPMTTEEQARLNNAAVQLEKMFGLEGMARPESSLDDALDLYDDVLQKADMDWDNVSDEELVQLEKVFGIKNPFGRESTSERAKRIGVELPTGSYGSKKEAPNRGFGARGRAMRAAREKEVKDAANRKRAGVESPARRRAARLENIKRAPGRAGTAVREKGSAVAGAIADKGTAGARATGRGVRTVGEFVEPAGIQRARGGGPKSQLSSRQQRRAAARQRNTPDSPSRFSRAFGATKRAAGAAGRTAKEMGREFNAGLSSVSLKNPLGTGASTPTGVNGGSRAPKKGWGGGAPPGTAKPYQRKQSLSSEAKRWSGGGGASGTQQTKMQKAVVSLQKFLDDCGCDG